MAQILNNSAGAVLSVVNRSNPDGSQGASVPAFTVSVSDPSNTCNWNPNTLTLTPNGTNNTGVVTLTITNSNDQTTTTAVVEVVSTPTDLEAVTTAL
jgi:hypothetical protein